MFKFELDQVIVDKEVNDARTVSFRGLNVDRDNDPWYVLVNKQGTVSWHSAKWTEKYFVVKEG